MKLFLNNPGYWIFIMVCIAIIIYLEINFTKLIRWFGEFWVKKELKKLPTDKYKVLNDIMIKTNIGTHQIDHIVISRYGIFVIETKQYNGYITGDKYDIKWVKHLGKKKYYYENPIRQNYGHVKAIAELLKLDKGIFNIVCIPSRAKLKINHDEELTNNRTILGKILSYEEEIINNPEIIANFILKNNITDRKQRKEHIKQIQNKMKASNSNICPKCGSILVERQGQYGSFFGCSNYPKCHFTKNH